MTRNQNFLLVVLFVSSTAIITLFYSSAFSDPSLEKEELLKKVSLLESQVDQLQKQLGGKHNKLPLNASEVFSGHKSGSTHTTRRTELDNPSRGEVVQEVPEAYQTIDKLRVLAMTNPAEAAVMLRTLAEKGGNENVAVVARAVYDLSKDTNSLPNDLLALLYGSQTDINLKRVSAQVMSQRGDNSLLQNYIDEGARNFTSKDANARSTALYELGKTGSKMAAAVIQPMLHDPDVSVRMDALLALRATGNQTHLNEVQRLLTDPDENVRELAHDVIENLSDLSGNARMKVADSDISSGLIGF